MRPEPSAFCYAVSFGSPALGRAYALPAYRYHTAHLHRLRRSHLRFTCVTHLRLRCCITFTPAHHLDCVMGHHGFFFTCHLPPALPAVHTCTCAAIPYCRYAPTCTARLRFVTCTTTTDCATPARTLLHLFCALVAQSPFCYRYTCHHCYLHVAFHTPPPAPPPPPPRFLCCDTTFVPFYRLSSSAYGLPPPAMPDHLRSARYGCWKTTGSFTCTPAAVYLPLHRYLHTYHDAVTYLTWFCWSYWFKFLWVASVLPCTHCHFFFPIFSSACLHTFFFLPVCSFSAGHHSMPSARRHRRLRNVPRHHLPHARFPAGFATTYTTAAALPCYLPACALRRVHTPATCRSFTAAITLILTCLQLVSFVPYRFLPFRCAISHTACRTLPGCLHTTTCQRLEQWDTAHAAVSALYHLRLDVFLRR